MKKAEVIHIRSDAFYILLETVIERIREIHGMPLQDKWISAEEAMKILNIRSRTTLQGFRDTGKIRFSKLFNKVILYDKNSLLDFIESNAKEIF